VARIVDSFQMSSSGRCGTITYLDEGRELEIYWEISGDSAADILLAPLDLRRWSGPGEEELSIGKQQEILARLRDWLAAKKIRSDIELPSSSALSKEKCAWAGCSQKTIEGCAYCAEHHDLNLLRLG
jgi:hypothetical protein